MPTGERGEKSKTPSLEHEGQIETAEIGQNEADVLLRAEVERVGEMASEFEKALSHDIAILDNAALDPEVTHLTAHDIAAARAELEHISITTQGLVRGFFGSVADIFYRQPIDAIQNYRSDLETKALSIPDNSKIIQKIETEVSAIWKKIRDNKRLDKLEGELRESWPKVSKVEFQSSLHKNTGIGREYKAKIYDEEIKARLTEVLRLYNTAAKHDPQVWQKLEGPISSLLLQVVHAECQAGNTEKLVEWWKKAGTIADDWTRENAAQNLLCTLTEEYQKVYGIDPYASDKLADVRPNFVEHAQANQEFIDSTVQKLSGAPELQTILRIKKKVIFDSVVNNSIENQALSVLSSKQLSVWDNLGADVKKFIMADLGQYGVPLPSTEKLWRVVLSHPAAAKLADECLDYITRSKAESYSNWNISVKNFVHSRKNEFAELARTPGYEDFAMVYESYSFDESTETHLIEYLKSLPVTEAAQFVRSHADRLPWSLVKDPDLLRTVCGFSDREICLLTVASFRNSASEVIAEHTDQLDTFTVKALLADTGVYRNNLANLSLFNFILAKHNRADSAAILGLMKEKDTFTMMYACAAALTSAAEVGSVVALYKQVPGLLHDVAAALMGGYINNYGTLKELQNPQFVLENFGILGIAATEVGSLISQAVHIEESKLNPLLLAYAENPTLAATPEYALLLSKANHKFLLSNYGKLGLTVDNLVERIIKRAADWRQTTPLMDALEAYVHDTVPLTENQVEIILTQLKFDIVQLGKIYQFKKNSPKIAAMVAAYHTAAEGTAEMPKAADTDDQELDQSLQDYFAFTGYGKGYFTHDKVAEYLVSNPDQGREVVSVLETAAVWGNSRSSAEAVVGVLAPLVAEPEVRQSFQEFNRFIEANAPVSLRLVDSRLLDRVVSQPDRTGMMIGILTECLPLVKEDTALSLVVSNLDRLSEIPASKRLAYVEVLYAVSKSPSQEVQRILEPLLKMLLEVENPKEAYRKIESIFIKNNLPLVGKIYKIFETLFPKERLNETLQGNAILSPYLRATGHEKRMQTIYTDLLRVHIESDNRSLRHYLAILKAGESACAVLDRNEAEEIPTFELKKIKHFIAKLNTLFANSQLVEAQEMAMPEGDISSGQARETYQQLRASLGVKDGQKTTDRIAELFLRPLGYQSIDAVLGAMKTQKSLADSRGRAYVQNAESGHLSIGKGDLLKGIDTQYLDSVLQNGSVAKEYLGASSSSDLTPFDTDLEMVGGVKQTTRPVEFAKTVKSMQADRYGDVLVVIKDRGQWQVTKDRAVDNYSRNKYELFKSGVVSSDHYGIRTGFASTEIDFLICKTETEQKKLFGEIVKNGYFIPVVDTSGKILFTPQMYDKARQAFAGLEHYDGGAYVVESTTEFDPQWAEVQVVKKELPQIIETVAETSRVIRSKLEAVLREQGIHLKESFDTSLLGAELLDTGSTGRHTNTADSFDFDLVLKLDVMDEAKVNAITAALESALKPQKNQSHDGNGGADIHQLRFFGATGIGPKPVDIDIAFVRKSGLSVYGSHDAVRDKLDNIKTNFGEDEYKTVLANIIVAKEMLKKANVYKKGRDAEGGLGGIGVENWLLAHGGNLARACEAFKQAAYDGIRRVSLAEFKRRYEINDPGINAKFLKHDNFVELLTDDGYDKMVKAVDAYVN